MDNKTKKPGKRLNLHKESLVALTPQMLSLVGGGSDSVGEACTDPGGGGQTHCTLVSIVCPVTSRPVME